MLYRLNMRHLKIEGEPNLVKDSYSKSILSNDIKGLEEYKKRRELRRQEKEAIIQCQNDINILSNELKDIKQSLKIILEKVSKG